MSNEPPWKLAVIGVVAVIAGLALLLVDWTLAELAAFAAMLFVARGALHIVTTSFEGLAGALSALLGCGEVGVGVALLAWPAPTLLALVLVVGSWVLLSAVVEATIVLATRADSPHWRLRFSSAMVELALAGTLIVRPGGTVSGAAVTLGVLGVFRGVLEISTAIARTRSERRVRTAAVVRSIAAVS
ncbi:MAG: hypothetical protein QOI44_513 [Actinomycetota bacterium]|nr:hypothetical protein [Actinomycetota bacterium]